MKTYRPLFAAVIALLFYTSTDILIWQRIFESNQMIHFADTYHTGWFISLFGYATVGVLLMWGGWKDCLYFLAALFIGAFSGLEDILYYVLDHKPMPISLPWLSNNPMIFDVSRAGVIGSAVFWIVALAVLYVALYWSDLRRTPAAASE